MLPKKKNTITVNPSKLNKEQQTEIAKKDQFKFELYSHNAVLDKINVIDHYEINNAKIYITDDGQYLIVEPTLSQEAFEIYRKMMGQIFYSMEPMKKSNDPINYIEQHLWKEAQENALTKLYAQNFTSLRYYLVRDILGYGILDVLLQDENIEEITVEHFDREVGIIHRKYSEFNILNTNTKFGSEDFMNSYVIKLVQKCNGTVTAAMPIVNVMTNQGDRVTCTFGREVSLSGPTLDIRKFTRQPFTIVNLLKFGALTPLMAAYYWLLTDAKAFGLVVGETGSGKTTLLNALMGLSNPRWKIITIEETPELKMPHQRWLPLTTRFGAMITQHNMDITIMDLIKASLRMRPDFELVGEVRGEEAQFMFQSAATGHGGMTTFHGSSAESALNRLASEPINIKASQQMLLWQISHVTRLRTAEKKITRKIVSIKEVVPQTESIKLHELFRYDQKTNQFNIESVEELIQKSCRAADAADVLNVDLAQDLEKRMEFLAKCQESNADTNDKVFSIIQDYYKA